MRKRLLGLAGASALLLASASLSVAQTPQNPQTKVVTTTQTQAVQNADGTWTVIEYPVNKEVIVDLTPGVNLTGATGRAKVHRMADHTMLHVDLSGLTGVNALNLYAVDPSGK